MERRSKKRARDEDEHGDDNDEVYNAKEELDEPQRRPARRLKENADTDTDRKADTHREKQLDDATAPELRRFRPTGYLINAPPQDRAVRIYADGVFDLFHVGHMKQLEQAKKAFPRVELVVGVPSDRETHSRKGLTVLSEHERYESLRHCKWVDQVVEDAPWCISMQFLQEHKIDYVAHDDEPYASGSDTDIYRFSKEAGMFLATRRTSGISTSDVIARIIRDYDRYLIRNFARGASRKELNVSWLKKNEIDFKRHVSHFRESFKTNLESASRDLYADVMAFLRGSDRREPRDSDSRDDFVSRYTNHSLMDNLQRWMRGSDSSRNRSSDDTDDDASASAA